MVGRTMADLSKQDRQQGTDCGHPNQHQQGIEERPKFTHGIPPCDKNHDGSMRAAHLGYRLVLNVRRGIHEIQTARSIG